MPYPQYDKVCPAVILEVADGLAAAFEVVVRQPRALAEYPRGAESAEVKQCLTQVEQDRLDSWLRILDSRTSFNTASIRFARRGRRPSRKGLAPL